jgi:hypothetical protein
MCAHLQGASSRDVEARAPQVPINRPTHARQLEPCFVQGQWPGAAVLQLHMPQHQVMPWQGEHLVAS